MQTETQVVKKLNEVVEMFVNGLYHLRNLFNAVTDTSKPPVVSFKPKLKSFGDARASKAGDYRSR